MSTSRRRFLQSAAIAPAAALGAAPPRAAPPDALAGARRHALLRTQPTPDFFEGILLGNGDIGVCVTVRPDAMGLHIGKNDSWDIRVSEAHAAHIKPFREVLQLWEQAGEEAKRQGQPGDDCPWRTNIDFFHEYTALMHSSYGQPWPRPWPCGIRVAPLGFAHGAGGRGSELDISTGVLTVDTRVRRPARRRADRHADLLCEPRGRPHLGEQRWRCARGLGCVSPALGPGGANCPSRSLPRADGRFSCHQEFPGHGAHRGSRIRRNVRTRIAASRSQGVLAGQLDTGTQSRRQHAPCIPDSAATQPFRLDVALFTTLDVRDNAAHARARPRASRPILSRNCGGAPTARGPRSGRKSAVELEDQELEAIWYRNQYFLACCLKPGKVAPGLFGNWTSGNIGTAWHGDYHMNYNTQQVWWGVFSSNHVEQHEPYTRLVENLMPMAEWNARVQFGLPGAYFPHSAYPGAEHRESVPGSAVGLRNLRDAVDGAEPVVAIPLHARRRLSSPRLPDAARRRRFPRRVS